MIHEALGQLVATPPSTYLDVISVDDHTQSTVLARLYRTCVQAQLIPQHLHQLEDGIQQLHALFDVALHYGLSAIILQYVRDMCHLPHPAASRDPIRSPFVRPSSVEDWLRRNLQIMRRKVSSLVEYGLSKGAATEMLPNDVGSLTILASVADALQAPQFGTDGEQMSSAGHAKTYHLLVASDGHATGKGIGRPPGMTDLSVEAHRLLQCSVFMTHIGQMQMRNISASGRFPTATAWKEVVAQRRKKSNPSPLFVDEMIQELCQHRIEPSSIQYPPDSLVVLVKNVFLYGDSSRLALEAKLALLGYCLVDGNFLTAQEVADMFYRSFHLEISRSLASIMLLFLDDARLAFEEDPKTNASLIQAANFLPGVHAPSLPLRALEVFAEGGFERIALASLRQCRSREVQNIDNARIALRVRLMNGLLVESFLEVKRYLKGLSHADAATLSEHTSILFEDILDWGLKAQGLNGIIRLPIKPGPEEISVKKWLESKVDSLPQAVMMLVLFDLIRGRIPEALYSYGKFSKYLQKTSKFTVTGDQPLGDTCEAPIVTDSMLQAAKQQLEELLANASRTLPDIQRTMIVREGSKPKLIVDGDSLAIDAETGVSLRKAVPGIHVDGTPRIVSIGPSPAVAPLVGGVAAVDALQKGMQRGTAGDTKGPVVASSLFRGQLPGKGEVSTEGPDRAMGAGVAPIVPVSKEQEASIDAPTAVDVRMDGGHELDRLLGKVVDRKNNVRRATRLSMPLGMWMM